MPSILCMLEAKKKIKVQTKYIKHYFILFHLFVFQKKKSEAKKLNKISIDEIRISKKRKYVYIDMYTGITLIIVHPSTAL